MKNKSLKKARNTSTDIINDDLNKNNNSSRDFKDLLWDMLYLHKLWYRSKTSEKMSLRNKLFKDEIKKLKSDLDWVYILNSI